MATRARKLLVGCGVGCLGLAALSIGACVSFTIWVNQPGEVLEPTRLLGRDTTGYVEWALRAEDPGTEAFVEGLIGLQERAQSRGEERGPAWLFRLIQDRRAGNRAEAVRALLPTVAAWTMRPGETDDSDLHLFTFNIQSLGNRPRFVDLMLRYTLGWKHSVIHADERIYSDENAGALFIRDNSFFLTNSEANARLIVDRMNDERWDADRDPTELESRISGLPERLPVRGAIGNSRGELWRIWVVITELDSGSAPPEFWSDIRGATLSGAFTGQTAFEGAFDFQGPDAGWAQANADPLLTMMRTEFDRGRLPAELRVDAVGDVIRVSFRFDDLLAFVDEL